MMANARASEDHQPEFFVVARRIWKLAFVNEDSGDLPLHGFFAKD
jgi:hypothetical protein